MSGTSMATPHVAGIIALMLEANPNLTPAQVTDILERTSTNMTGRLAWEAGTGHVNAYAAVAERSEEHTSELQSLMRISYAVFCLKKNKHTHHTNQHNSE